jgi:Uma2 family endonuclease
MQYITFVNESPLHVNIEAWQPMFAGFMSEMKTQLVRPGERIIMGSETGEWTLNTYFFDKELSDEWGHRNGEVIGKIQEAVCKDKIGVYSWIYNTDFIVVCENRVATFSKK